MARAIAEQAREAKTVIQAARLRERLLEAFADEPNMPDDRARELNLAIDELEARFPDIAELSYGEAEELAAGIQASRGGKVKQPSKGRGATLGERRTKARERGVRDAGRRATGQSRSKPSRSARGRGSSRVTGARRFGRARLRETGLPAAGASATALVMQLIGMTLGLALLYLFLRNAQAAPRGRSAIEELSSGTARAVRLLISPIDPIAPGAYRATRGGANKPIRVPRGPAPPAGAAGPIGVTNPATVTHRR
jgi:hypothetical protein